MTTKAHMILFYFGTMASWIIIVLTLAFTVLINSILRKKRKSTKQVPPPGPKGLPILGSFHLMGELPHQDLYKLSQKYGPIMQIRLGLVPTIVVSSPEAAQLFLKTHDLVFASRPCTQATKYMNYRRKGIVFTEYGSYWRNIRKLCSLELLTNSKIETYRHMRKEEVGNLIEVLKGAADARKAVCLSEMVEKVVEDMMFRMIFGFKDDRFRFKPIITEMLELVGAFNVGDYVPFLAPFDVQRLVPRMKAASKKYDELLEKIIEEHIKDGKEQYGKARDFIHLMLSLMESDSTKGVKFGKDNIKAIILDVLGAGLDTSANAVNWAFPELLRHPKVMKKVQEELRDIVGMDRMVEETDLPKLNYLNMVIKESMRLHPVAPLLVPHESIEETTINGYFIPKKSRVLVNVWTIGRDPNVWSEDAEKFNPDRFIDVEVDIHGRDFQLIPSGSGRRICPGMNLGLLVVQLVLAQLLHCFTWELPDGVNPRDLDMTEKFALTMSRASNLHCIPSYRLSL